MLERAWSTGALGPYQLQAAIAAVHDEAPSAEETDWPQILALYEVLEQVSPGPVVTLNRAVAVARVHGPRAGLALVGTLDKDERMAHNHRLEAVIAVGICTDICVMHTVADLRNRDYRVVVPANADAAAIERQRERLLAQDVLAREGGALHPGAMQAVGQRDVLIEDPLRAFREIGGAVGEAPRHLLPFGDVQAL